MDWFNQQDNDGLFKTTDDQEWLTSLIKQNAQQWGEDGSSENPLDEDEEEEENKEEDDEDKDEYSFLEKGDGRTLLHKRGFAMDLSVTLKVLYSAIPQEQHERMLPMVQHLIMGTYGKRNLKKEAVEVSHLDDVEKEVYRRIRRALSNQERRRRVFEFIEKKGVTKRLINYFVVQYPLVEKEISYYLDRGSYPYKIVGKLNETHQPDILRRIEQGEKIHWVNFYQEYKNSKRRDGRRNRHAPYRRSVLVRGEDGIE